MLSNLAENIRDNNIRLANCEGNIHAISAKVHVEDADPFVAMEQLLASSVGESINVEHAFYLGLECQSADSQHAGQALRAGPAVGLGVSNAVRATPPLNPPEREGGEGGVGEWRSGGARWPIDPKIVVEVAIGYNR